MSPETVNDLAILNAVWSIVDAQRIEIEAMQLARAYERNEKWLDLNPLEFGKMADKFKGKPPRYLVESYQKWKAHKA